ncbi:TIGR03503 family protein [Vibrio sp.]|uniref:TIGR03503 family protein n=1 Tax=Vibrio sp. TaxID=678 RepID=UPI003D0EC506
MWRIGIAILGWLIGFNALASNESTMSLLDNRFRVDSTISQITFVIYREKNSQPVVLVRPDGTKYYAGHHPDYVRWYEEPSMDIISIDNPMPGPWQAIGKVSPKNNIRLISHLQMLSDPLPSRLYQGEEIKFTARLVSDGQPLLLRDFLDRVNLTVTFTKYIENEQELEKEAQPLPIEVGLFADDGRGLDEKAGDGVFTVALPISLEPDKYRVRITSGNGVFLRAQEQEVLVYPSPITTTFIQSRADNQPHQVIFSGEGGMIQPGSLAGQVEHKGALPASFITQAQADDKALNLTFSIPNSGEFGHFSWHGLVYATDLATQRPLVFPIKEHRYSVVSEIDLDKTRRMQEADLENLRRLQQEKLVIQMREKSRQKALIYIVLGNVFVILLALGGWFIRRKLQAKAAATPELQLKVPKK